MALDFKIPFRGGLQRNFESADNGEYGTVLTSNPSSSIVNDFIPFHALMSGKLLSTISNKVLLYNLDVLLIPEHTVNGYEEFFYRIIGHFGWNKLNKRNVVPNYRCRAGQLVVISKDKVVTPLMTLVVNKEYLFTINKEQPDYSKFFIVIDDNFSNSDEHSNLYKNFRKYYLEEVSNYINVIHTKSIINFCYKQVPVVPIKPKTIAESRVLYKEMTLNIIRAIAYKEYT
jgi:hypothetical protein